MHHTFTSDKKRMETRKGRQPPFREKKKNTSSTVSFLRLVAPLSRARCVVRAEAEERFISVSLYVASVLTRSLSSTSRSNIIDSPPAWLRWWWWLLLGMTSRAYFNPANERKLDPLVVIVVAWQRCGQRGRREQRYQPPFPRGSTRQHCASAC